MRPGTALQQEERDDDYIYIPYQAFSPKNRNMGSIALATDALAPGGMVGSISVD